MSSGASTVAQPARDGRGHVYLPPVRVVLIHHVQEALSGGMSNAILTPQVHGLTVWLDMQRDGGSGQRLLLSRKLP